MQINIKIVLDGKLITARVLRSQLDSGEEEILVTNLMEDTLGTPCIHSINMVSLIKNEANETISQNDKGKKLKYQYKVNENIIIGNLKDSMVRLLLEESQLKRKAMFTRMTKEIIKNKTPIIPGRKYQLNKVLKYAHSRKRCL